MGVISVAVATTAEGQSPQLQILHPLNRLQPSSFPIPSKPTSLSLSSSPPFLSSPSLLTRPTSIRIVPRASASSNWENIAEILGQVTIFKATGESVMFKDLWDQNEGMAVVALLRHFGCPCCWELASTLKESKARFDDAGVKLIAVGIGDASKAHLLADRLPFPVECLYADPERKAYDMLSLYYGLGRTFFNPASVKVFSRFESLRMALKNYTIEATPYDRRGVLQQGGMFVFKGKQLVYARKDEGTGDHAPLDDVFNICCKVSMA